MEKKCDFLLLPKAETCFPIIIDVCFMNQFTGLILVTCLSQQTLTLLKLAK